MSGKTKKAINFDLDTKALKLYYPGKSYRKAYSDIKNFLVSHDYKHRQWSGYISTSTVSNDEVKRLANKMSKQFPWLKKCVNKFDVTDIGQQHDLTHLITGKSKSKVQKVEKTSEKTKTAYMPRSVLAKQAEKLHKAPHKTLMKTKNKNNEIE